jgi:hypothetical protein
MVRAAVNERHFDIDTVLGHWYNVAFGEMPPIGHIRKDVFIVTSYELLYAGYVAFECTECMSDTFKINYKASGYLLTDKEKAMKLFGPRFRTIDNCLNGNEGILEEPLTIRSYEMAEQKTPRRTLTRSTASSDAGPGKGKGGERKETAGPAKMSELQTFFVEQLVAGKLTDEEICLAAKEKFGVSYNGNPGYIVIARNNINKGKYNTADKTYPTVNRIVDYKGKKVPLSDIPETEQAAVIAENKKILKGGKSKDAPAKKEPEKKATAKKAAAKKTPAKRTLSRTK